MSVEESQHAAEDLDRFAAQLHGLVGRFHFTDARRRPARPTALLRGAVGR